jgi:hypothetical protein
MTGRGEGDCAVELPSPESGDAAGRYAGLQGTPVQPALGAPLAGWPYRLLRLRRRFGRRGRGRRFARR